jgi:hypothetical protein
MNARNNYLIWALWLFLLGLTPVGAEAAQLVVVQARGVAFSPGATVDSSKRLVLKAGQHLTLISPSGATIKLDGPYSDAPDAGGGSGGGLGTQLSALLAGGRRQNEVGTTRATARQQIPSPQLLDISRSGTVCLLDGSHTPVLWHPAPAKDSKITLMPADRSWRADYQWPAGHDRLEVAGNVLLRDGATYFVSMNGDQSAIIVSMLPASLATDDMRTAWMLNKGCEAQAEAMVRQAQ